jgi:hypothetical protein
LDVDNALPKVTNHASKSFCDWKPFTAVLYFSNILDMQLFIGADIKKPVLMTNTGLLLSYFSG